MKHKVSIIIPCFNEEKNIKACLESIFNLKYSKQLFEVIVVDNGSTDKTRDIVSQYDVILLMDDQKKVAGLRNLGAESSTGSILAFVDADCIVSEDWLTCAEAYFEKEKVAAWGAPPIIPENATWVQQAWYLVRQKKNEIEDVEWLESMNLFVRKNAFNKVNGFNEALETAEDVDLCYRIAKIGRVVSDTKIVVVHTGEAADVKTFFKKELWRGIGNFSGIKSHGISIKEIPSLAVPLYYGLYIPFLLIWVVLSNSFFVIQLLIFSLFVPALIVVVKVFLKKRDTQTSCLWNLFVLVQIYFVARTLSILKTK